MSYYLPLPDGSFVEVPDNIPQEQAERQIALDPRYRPIIEQSFRQKSAGADAYGYLMRGVGQIPTAAGSLINVVPGMEDNIVGRGLRSAGQAISDYGTSQLSEGTRKQQALFDLAMQEAENKGLGEQAKTALAEAIRNPRIVAGVAIESLPSLATALVGGLAVRGAAGVASRVAGRQLTQSTAARAGVAGAVGTESLLEGGGSADEVYRTITALSPEQLQRSPEYQELLKQGLNPNEAKERLAVSAARQAAAQTAAISGTVGAIMPGAEGAMFRPMTRQGVVGRALGTGLSELGQEAGQEGGAALSENIARQRAEVDRELLAGVGSRATIGAITGGLTGAGVGAARRGPGAEIDRAEDTELRNILNEYVNVRGEAPAVSERDAGIASFVASNLPVSEEQFLSMPGAARARVAGIARNRADRAATSEQERSFRQEAEIRAGQEAVTPNLKEDQIGEPGVAPEVPAFEFPADVKRALQDIRSGIKPPERKSLMQFLRTLRYEAQGLGPGISDVNYGNEVKNILGNTKRIPGLINNKKGVPLDRARELAVESGYLPDGADINDLLDAIMKEDREGVRNYGNSVRPEAQLEYEERVRNAQQLERALYEAGSDVDRPDNEIAAALGLEFPTKPRTLEDIEAESQSRFAGVPPKELGITRREWETQRRAFWNAALTPEERNILIVEANRDAGRPAREVAPTLEKRNAAIRAWEAANPPPAPTSETAEYSRRKSKKAGKPKGPIGSTAPMGVEIPEAFRGTQSQAEQTEQPAQQAPDREAAETKRQEILQRLNYEYLAKLEAKGPQGKRAADAVRKSLADRTLTAEQLYGAFKGAEVITNTLPANANHEIEFVKHLTNASGEEVQGKRIEVKDSSAAGIIKLSLAENQLALLNETASHEAFHVLQDYYGKYDPDFRKLMKQSFRDGMTINDVDSTIKRKLQTTRMPNGEQSYWDALSQSLPDQKLSAREAEAYVFGSLADAARRGVPMTGMKPAFTRFVNFLTKFFKRMKSAIRGDGFNTPEDVLGRVVEGDAARFAGREAPEFQGSESSARLPPGSATYQAAAKKINGDRLKQDSVLKRGIDALVGSRAEYTYLYSGKKEAVKGKTSLALNMVNRAHPAHLMDNLSRLQGRPQMADVGRAWESAMNNDGRIARMVEAGGYKYDKKQGIPVIDKAVKSLGDIFMGRVKAEESDAAQRYFVALRERDLRKQGRQGFTNISDNEINEIIKYSETNRPEWKNVAKDYDAWNKGLVQFLVDTDVIKQDVADQLGNTFYTPFYRLLEEDGKTNPDEVIGPSTAAAMKNPSDALKKLGGGEQQLGNLFENIIRNADAIVRSGLKNVAMQKTVTAMEAAGLAKKVPTKVTGAKNIATIRKNGDNVYYQIDEPLMMIAISTMPETMQNGIYQAMTSVGGFIRDMITSAPSFMLANLWRGKVVSYVQEGVPLTRSTALSLRDALKQTASFGAIQDVTGFGGLTYGMGSRDVASEFQRQLRMKDGGGSIMDRVKGIIVGLQRFSEATEMAERMKLTEYHLSKGKSLNEAAWEGYAMAPFSRRGMGQGGVGSTVSFLAPLVPFLNARIQGNYRLIEKMTPATFGRQLLLRGMVLTAFSLGLAMLASDDERWDRETPDRKFMYDIFYAGDKAIMIPRAFEVGTFFGALPVFMYDAIRKGSGEDLGRAFGLTAMSTFGFTPIPAAIAPVLEVATNYDFFLGRELESAGIRSRPVSERVQPGTTEAAKLAAAAVNETLGNLPRGMKAELSPIQAQALLEGYLGTTGMMMLSAIDGLLGWTGATPKRPAGPLGDPNSPLGIAVTLSGVKRFIKGDEERVDRFVGDFYDLKREVTQWTAALSDAANAGNLERVKEIQQEQGATLGMRNAVNQVGRAVAQVSRQMKAIYDNRTMDENEKAAALAPLREQRNRLTERIMQLAKEQGVR